MEAHLAEPLPASVQLILGVFTVPQDSEYREVVRNTWLQQTGVCYWQETPRENCSVYVAFVIGKKGTGSKAKVTMSDEDDAKTHLEPGMLVLDTGENMNAGKSPFWFKTAVRKFPWATHIGKMDMDTYPFLHKLVNRMSSDSSCVEGVGPYEFIGRPHTTWWRSSGNFSSTCTPRRWKQFLSAQDESKEVAPLDQPWHFLSGELYILSRSLAEKVDWHRLPGTEDCALSTIVDEAAIKHGFCVVMRRLDAWYHRNDLCEPWYANNF